MNSVVEKLWVMALWLVLQLLVSSCGLHESRSLTEVPSFNSGQKPTQTTEEAFIAEIQSSDLEAIRARIETGTSVDLRLENGRTPLMIAAIWGRTEIARFLIEKGASVDLVDVGGRDVWSYAEGKADFIRVLPNRLSDQKKVELFEFVNGGNYRALKSELDSGVDPNLRDNNGRTFLIAAVQAKKLAVVAMLARYPGVDLSLKDNHGFSARYFAETLGDQQILRELISRGAN